MKVFIVPIVEGKTEQGPALSSLLNKVWNTLLNRWEPLSVQPAVRGSRPTLAAPDASGELAKRIRQANNDLAECLDSEPGSSGLILLLPGSDEDCPAKLGPVLLAAAQLQCPDCGPFTCVLAKKEFENWLIAGAAGFAGKAQLQLPDPLPALTDPEGMKGSGWLAEQRKKLSRSSSYKNRCYAVDGFCTVLQAQKLSLEREFCDPELSKLVYKNHKLLNT